MRSSPTEDLAALGLCAGLRVRWRRSPGGNWRYGLVRGRERDGSIGVTEEGGAARSIPVERLFAECRGARGARTWEAVTLRASRSEQLPLFG